MLIIGERMYNTSASQNIPPINVTFTQSLLSCMVKMAPSPDWFVGFSDFQTIAYDTQTYYNRFVLQSYVWDCGTDGGQTYTALDDDLLPQKPVSRFTVNNVPPMGQFLSPDGTFIPVPAEFECVLRVGDGPVIPGQPFNESQIRPPLYVPRPEDDWIGNPAYTQNRCSHGNYKGCSNYKSSAVNRMGVTGVVGGLAASVGSILMMTIMILV